MNLLQEHIKLLQAQLVILKRMYEPVKTYAGGRNCQRGYNCGGSCIARAKNCRKALPGEAKNYSDYLTQKLGSAAGGGDAVKATAPNAEPKPKIKAPKPEGKYSELPPPIEPGLRMTKAQADAEIKRLDEEIDSANATAEALGTMPEYARKRQQAAEEAKSKIKVKSPGDDVEIVLLDENGYSKSKIKQRVLDEIVAGRKGDSGREGMKDWDIEANAIKGGIGKNTIQDAEAAIKERERRESRKGIEQDAAKILDRQKADLDREIEAEIQTREIVGKPYESRQKDLEGMQARRKQLDTDQAKWDAITERSRWVKAAAERIKRNRPQY